MHRMTGRLARTPGQACLPGPGRQVACPTSCDETEPSRARSAGPIGVVPSMPVWPACGSLCGQQEAVNPAWGLGICLDGEAQRGASERTRESPCRHTNSRIITQSSCELPLHGSSLVKVNLAGAPWICHIDESDKAGGKYDG